MVFISGCEIQYASHEAVSEYKTTKEIQKAIILYETRIQSNENTIVEFKETRDFLKKAAEDKSEFFTTYDEQIVSTNKKIEFETFKLSSNKLQLVQLKTLLDEKENEK